MSMEVNEGMTNLLSHMKEDYHRWSMLGRTVHSNTEDFIRETEIRERMEEEYNTGLGYELHTKYIKVVSDKHGSCSVCAFVVATENDKKFRFGDILKPADAMASNLVEASTVLISFFDLLEGICNSSISTTLTFTFMSLK
mgnify:CR=1 FL=1